MEGVNEGRGREGMREMDGVGAKWEVEIKTAKSHWGMITSKQTIFSFNVSQWVTFNSR